MKRSTAKRVILILDLLMIVIAALLGHHGERGWAVICIIVFSCVVLGVRSVLCCKKCGRPPRSWLATFCPYCGEPLDD